MKISLSDKLQLFGDAFNSYEADRLPECTVWISFMNSILVVVIVNYFGSFYSLTTKSSIIDFIHFSVFVGIPVMIIWVFFVRLWDAVITYNIKIIKKYGISTMGIITNKTEGHSNCFREYSIEYTFEYEAIKYKNTFNPDCYDCLIYYAVQIGEKIPVKFLASNPKKALLIYKDLLKKKKRKKKYSY